MNLNLFTDSPEPVGREELVPGAVLLHGFGITAATVIFAELDRISALAPFRHMITPGGFRMSVAMTNCGRYGWVSDSIGYRYESCDPETNKPWPAMPSVFLQLAQDAAASAGFIDFTPDACLINRYTPGARLSLHQDKDEKDFTAPIISVSLGLAIVFLLGGLRRKDQMMRILLTHGDVIAWGGSARLRYHGTLPLKAGYHALAGGGYRFNLTFRKAT